jgi:hypothetical protein
MSIDSQHKQHTEYLETWHMLRDCDKGAKAVKTRSLGGESNTLYGERGTAYLPPPNPTDLSSENRQRYRAYRNRANYVNFVGSTKEGLCGLVWRKELGLKLGATIDYLEQNANGDGIGLQTLVKESLSEVLLMGRQGLLVDYPPADEGLTRAQVQSMELQANILCYKAESILNWRCTVVGGVRKLSLVVLEETLERQGEDQFTYEEVTVYRVLELTEGVYTQTLYDKDGKVLVPSITPRKSDGSYWAEIPFIFVGAINNDDAVDKPPLYDIAEINLSHYRNSADLEEASFICGQPTPVISGLTQSWVDANFKDGLHFGSTAFVALPEGGNAALLQAAANSMPVEAMATKEVQMVKMGARIIEEGGGQETAEAARIRFAGQNSKLGLLISNVEGAFERCIEWVSMFMGETQFELEINRQLYQANVDPQLLMATLQLTDRAIIGKADLRQILRRSGLIDEDRTDEMLDNDAMETDPLA